MCGGGGGEAQVQSAGPYEKKLVELSAKRLKEYEELYIPLENERIAEARGSNSASKQQRYTNDAVTAARLQTASNPVSPQAGGKMATVLGSQQGNQVAGMTAAMGKQVAEDDYANRMLQMAGLGRQQSGNAVQNTGAAAAREVSTKVASTQANQYVSNAKYGMYGSIAGVGAGWANEEYNLFGLKDKP